MSTNEQKDKPKADISYYGKKTYILNPALVRVRPPKDQGELFCFEDVAEKERAD